MGFTHVAPKVYSSLKPLYSEESYVIIPGTIVKCRVSNGLLPFRAFAMLATLLTLSASNWAGEPPTVPTSVRTYSLHGSINSADISPEETLIAVERTSERKVESVNVTQSTEILELWDFRADKLIASATLRGDEVERPKVHNMTDRIEGSRFVRFTGDGRFIVVYIEPAITILRASDLTKVKSINADGPRTIDRTFDLKKLGPHTVTYRASARAFEISPSGTMLAILWTQEMFDGRIDVYDLAFGQRIATWRKPQGWASYGLGHGLASSSDSVALFLAVPNSIPCMSPTGAPDVFVFGAKNGAFTTSLTTGLLVGDIAVTPNGQLLAVDSNCVGVFANHHPALKVFDLKTDRHLRDVHAPPSGIRYSVSVSRDGERAVASTSGVRCKFDWGDMNCGSQTVEPRFTVWHLPEFSLVANWQPSVNSGHQTAPGRGERR